MDHFAKILENVDAFLREGKTEEALDLLLDAKDKLDPNTYSDLLILKNRFSIANIEKHKGLMDQREYLRECSNKISTVQKIDGESMKKEIVLERAVEVVASEQFMMTNLNWTDSQIVLSSQKELDHFIAFNFLTQSPLVRRTLIVLFFISLSAGMYALVQHFDWSQLLHPTPKRVATSTPIIKSIVPNDTLLAPLPKETPIPAVAV
jgi:hypothetical protein